jgi:aryl-alcohol dehydrogenase-like predicted oxidoreductase
MSKLVIGGVSLSHLRDRDIQALFASAEALGVHEIDTAPAYGLSEEKIGKNLKNFEIKVNSKIFSPDVDSISRREVRRSVDNSLSLLRLESLHTLFLHSIREPLYRAEIHEELLKLKSEGKIVNLGYSGDGYDLRTLTSSYKFDAFQATLNVVDLGNLQFIRSNESMQSYIKRPLCNQVFKIKPKLEAVDFFYRLKRSESRDPQSYLARYKALFGNRLFARGGVDKVFGFIMSLHLNSKIIVGVSSVDHLAYLANLTSEFPTWSELEIAEHTDNWTRMANEETWKTLT